jgi:hypothetical protein
MTGLVRKATLLVVLGLMAASAAMAGIPSPANCTVPTYLDVYACKTSVPDPLNAVNPYYGWTNKIIVRDLSNNPIAGCQVSLTFCSDVKLYTAVPGHSEFTVVCPPSYIAVNTDVNGVAQFYLVGATINPNGVAAGTGANCAQISACGVPLGFATVTVFDENGAVGVKGVESGDLAGWLGDFGRQGTIGYKGRSDFNHVVPIASGDLSVWLKVFGLTNSGGTCGTLCQ